MIKLDNKKVIFGGFMGVGKTTLEKTIRERYGDQVVDTHDEKFFVANAEKGINFTDVVQRQFTGLKNGCWGDACLHTHLITESFIFNKSPGKYVEILERMEKHYRNMPQYLKDEYIIVIIKKSWFTIKENICKRGRPHEEAMLKIGSLNEAVYNLFYDDVYYAYKRYGFNNVELIDCTTNVGYLLTLVEARIKIYI